MSEYWRNHYRTSVARNASSPLKQVGKTVSGVEVDIGQVNLIVEHICRTLRLGKNDYLVDLGCGNGMLTVRLAAFVSRALGLDFTEGMLAYARGFNSSENLDYRQVDLTSLTDHALPAANKFTMYEVIQHLEVVEFEALIDALGRKSMDAALFLGGIPDREKLRSFYDTEEKYSFYLEREKSGAPHLGRWWVEEEVMEVGTKAGWLVKRIEQPAGLYTSHYRFDALLTRNSG